MKKKPKTTPLLDAVFASDLQRVPLPAAHLLSDHYNRTRSRYYRELDYASKSGGDVSKFIAYAVQGFVDGLRQQLKEVRDQQWTVSWENYVYDLFKHQNTETGKRRRDLVLELGRRSEAVKTNDLMELPRLVRAYARKTSRTLFRDISEVAALGVVEQKRGTVRARKEIILAFLPARNRTAR